MGAKTNLKTLLISIGFCLWITSILFELREASNYMEATGLKSNYENGKHKKTSHEEKGSHKEQIGKEYYTNIEKFGIKVYAVFWVYFSLCFVNICVAVIREYTFCLFISGIYIITSAYDFIKGHQPMECPRTYEGFDSIPETKNLLLVTCEYHIKNIIMSWIHFGLVCISVTIFRPTVERMIGNYNNNINNNNNNNSSSSNNNDNSNNNNNNENNDNNNNNDDNNNNNDNNYNNDNNNNGDLVLDVKNDDNGNNNNGDLVLDVKNDDTAAVEIESNGDRVK